MAYPLIYNREQWAYLYIDWFVVIVQQQVPLVNMKKTMTAFINHFHVHFNF